MDIFVSNVPEQLNEKEVENFFREHVKAVGCNVLHVRKIKNRATAFVTIHDENAAVEFLSLHGKDKPPLMLLGNSLICKPAHKKPDPLTLKALAKEEQDFRLGLKKKSGKNIPPSQKTMAVFPFSQLYCGLWETEQGTLVFHRYYQDLRGGCFNFGNRSLRMRLESVHHAEIHVLYDIFFHAIDVITFGNVADPHVTFTLLEPPKIAIKDPEENYGEDYGEDIWKRLAGMLSLQTSRESRDSQHSRASHLHPDHELAAGHCLVYKVMLKDVLHLREVQRTLSHIHGSPPCVGPLNHFMIDAPVTFRNQVQKISQVLQMTNRSTKIDSLAHKMPYALQFQFLRLVYNGILSPLKVQKLIFPVQNMLSKFSVIALVQAIRKVAMTIPTASPAVDPSVYSTKRLIKSIHDVAAAFKFGGSVYDTAKRHEHLGMIYRVMITPTGMLLEGPELETKNRVLRKYPDHIDYFMRVTFSDEDYEPIRWNRSISPNSIYQGRFRTVLTNGINICGRQFKFLGFSNSSLHTHQCWFMAPFIQKSSGLIHAPHVIKDLGDFTVFRSPAKCAARIGQTFSDATDTIKIEKSSIFELNDIERPDHKGVMRNFSDGVGPISHELLQDVWREFKKARKEHATLLQIRFQGAKGMLALDTRLPGKQLGLRPSMVKFKGSSSLELEICGAGYRRLPLFLNRQFIKILEDLGVSPEPFLALQREAVEKIRQVMLSPINAARFLEVNFVCVAAHIPQFIRSLWDLGHNFRDDPFLTNVVEMAAFARLREIKYRARIPVENGHTLYGIVDETGILEPDEIYAVIRCDDGSREILKGQVLISRAPALHPGDIQIVTAVQVPEDSYLKSLHNCVVFSQKGDRDLPSMLSGGDLDGDIFQLIFEPTIWPSGTYTPADYERVKPIDIGRPVEETDIINFFLSYMESDQLGRIANTHVQVADQKPNGTLSDECLALAELHSTAVDFAKTGIQVDMSKFPKTFNRTAKPDFMATAPRMLLGKDKLTFEDIEELEQSQENALSGFGFEEVSRPRFYVSDKVLGQLYRAIDEQRIQAEIRSEHPSTAKGAAKADDLLQKVFYYVISKTMHVNWEHRREEAREIRSRYDENLIETAFQYSSDTRLPLAELEVFTGLILGRSGGILNKRLRERNIDMKEKFERDVAFTISWIMHGDRTVQDAGAQERFAEAAGETTTTAAGANASLERSIACLAVAMEELPESSSKFDAPQSFKYVAAGVCLREVKKLGRRYAS